MIIDINIQHEKLRVWAQFAHQAKYLNEHSLAVLSQRKFIT